jgi:porin
MNKYFVNNRTFMLACALLLSALATPLAFGQSSASAGSSPPAEVNEAQSSQSPGEADLLTRSALTGDWWGARSSLANHGVSVDFRYTLFYQGLVSGTGDKGFDYGGKMDAFIDLDSSKMGLWQGGGFRSHIEYSHGGLATNLSGAIFATNLALYFPVDTPNEVVATSLYFTQKLGDRSSIAIGKFNPVDLYAPDPMYGGWGIDGS